MDIIISSSSGKPIYEQISSQIKAMILYPGQLREGDSLPSMRLLAKELRISLITTKRAYNDLQQEGFIQTITGKGSFVAAQDPQSLRAENLGIAREHLQRAVETARASGISYEELSDVLKTLYHGE